MKSAVKKEEELDSAIIELKWLFDKCNVVRLVNKTDVEINIGRLNTVMHI